MSAQTGSGKTVAFGLGLAGPLLGEAAKFGRAGEALALVVTPTRELAQQVHRELTWLYADTGARITTCVGGFDPRREQHALAQGVHIVVGTPGRLCDHLERGALKLGSIQAVVLDEADEMLDMGFREDLERLLDATPATRRTLLFSATIPKDIAAMAKRYQRDALRLATQSETDRHRDIEYHAIPIIPRERDLAVVNVLRYHDAPGALVFCATRDGVTHLAANLAERGFSVAALSGELTQRERSHALQALRDGRARVCVATDVAARGLDLPDLGLVIHADLPQNAQALVHRSGRTGRAGRRGVAIVLVPDAARRYVERMLKTAHVDVQWMRGPTADDILARDRERLATEITELATELSDEDRGVARQLLETKTAEELVAALVRIRREARPAPEELTLPPSMRPQQPRRSFEPRFDERPRNDGPRNDGPRNDRRPDRRSADPAAGPGDRRAAFAEAPREQDKPRGVRRAPFAEQAEPEDTREGTREGTRDLREQGPRPPRTDDGAWFTINVGRSKNADPKWLIPLLCRRGNITKREIGKIQIFARETRVEISPAAAASFAEAVRRPDPKDKNIHIEPVDGSL